MYTYYFKYVQGDAGLMSLYNLVGLVPLVAGCYLFKAWYNVDGNKGVSPLMDVSEPVSP